MTTHKNTRKTEKKQKPASSLAREIKALTKLYNDGHLSAAEHKRRYDGLVRP